MGAENYMWVTRYQKSLAKALDTTRRETFAAGRFLGAEKKPSSIAAALEAVEGDTGSLLDIMRVSKIKELAFFRECQKLMENGKLRPEMPEWKAAKTRCIEMTRRFGDCPEYMAERIEYGKIFSNLVLGKMPPQMSS